MKRLLTLLALAGLATAAACGDDSGGGGGKPTEQPTDAGKPGADTGMPAVVVRPVQVENPGAACSATSTTDCKGPAATCETSLMVGMDDVKLTGGYCSAQCNASAECGTGGGCPAADITAALPPAITALAGGLTGLVPSNCLDKCDKAVATDCRSGYECKSIAELIPANLQAIAGAFTSGPAFKVTYCLPPIDLAQPDAGARPIPAVDSGVRTGLDGGVDGGL